MANSQAIKDSARIFKLIRQKSYSATLETLKKAAKDLLNNMEVYKKYLSLTGNTFTSTSVGIYYKGALVFHLNESDLGWEDPVRETLAEGERMNLGDAYEESPRRKEDGSYPDYRGKYGKGGQWGPSLGLYHLRRFHPPKYKTWVMAIVIPVSYAGMNKKIVKTLQTAMNALPSVVDYDIVRVEDVPVQTDAFKDVMDELKDAAKDAPF